MYWAGRLADGRYSQRLGRRRGCGSLVGGDEHTFGCPERDHCLGGSTYAHRYRILSTILSTDDAPQPLLHPSHMAVVGRWATSSATARLHQISALLYTTREQSLDSLDSLESLDPRRHRALARCGLQLTRRTRFTSVSDASTSPDCTPWIAAKHSLAARDGQSPRASRVQTRFADVIRSADSH
ncbi:hypothetical protein K439DRAFT_945253 [Ramaria rubella]|nr:hypothetical protein K439DRAFT_945253 [Ramaria rubella]